MSVGKTCSAYVPFRLYRKKSCFADYQERDLSEHRPMQDFDRTRTVCKDKRNSKRKRVSSKAGRLQYFKVFDWTRLCL